MSCDEHDKLITGDGRIAQALRSIPPINSVIDSPTLAVWLTRLPRSLLVEAATSVLEQHRQAIRGGGASPESVDLEELARRTAAWMERSHRMPLEPVINATGILIHTGLGRAPLADSAVKAMEETARYYAPVEVDMASGHRGERTTIVKGLLCDLTGAESATVVNNNAAAMMVVLSTVARERSVVVSRGELLEIGGGFRLPDIMNAGGAILREVGTTNKTRLSDYEEAIDDWTAGLMKVHTSNYRVEGFVESVSIEELTDLAHCHGLPLIDDIGSGALHDLRPWGIEDEPVARVVIEAGADLVLFSGDKLLGGPQSGIIVGRTEWIEKIEKHPMMRALRVDKLVLAALGATLQLHRDLDLAIAQIPILVMLRQTVRELERRARRLVQQIEPLVGINQARVESSTAYLGGGASPNHAVPSVALRLSGLQLSEEKLAARLRQNNPPIFPRVQDGSVWIDLRTVFPNQDSTLFQAIRSAF